MRKDKSRSPFIDSIPKEDEIDFNILKNFLLRNKFTIATATILSFLLSCIYALSIKRTWEGQFQIVLSTNSSKPSSMIFEPMQENILNKIGISANKSDLRTEVRILESPLVLMPIFDFINSENQKRKPNYQNLEFIKWREKHLKVRLLKNTSILDISYKDQNKKLILPVLKKISSEYQIYSGRTKKRGINLTKDYLNKQITEYKVKNSESLKAAQEYAMDQDLTMLDFQSNNSQKETLNYFGKVGNTISNLSSQKKISGLGFIDSTNIEEIRVNAANEIKSLKSKIKRIKELDNEDDQIQYISLALPQINSEGTSILLDDLNNKIIDLKTKYLKDDPLIISLELRKKNLTKYLKERSIGLLKSQIIMEEARMDSATRPKGVILKYKELMRKAARNESILINLENQLSSLKLEEAKSEDPWELITKPTILNNPVAPKRKEIGLIGVILGFIFGIIISFARERRLGLIFEKSTIEKYLNLKVIDDINLGELNSINPKESMLSNILSANIGKEINFISTGNLNEGDFRIFKEFALKINKKIIFREDLQLQKGNETNILIISLEKINLNQIETLKKSIDLFGSEIYGIILLN
tara:strand:+ start:970 stop:2733 length:1764 start_codon:yes stop_codon:yes gene_type:complete